MITPEEQAKMNEIKALLRDGRRDLISREDQQWVLTVLSREGGSMPAAARDEAVKKGFNVNGITVG